MLDFFVYFSCSVFDHFADRPFNFNTHTLPMHYHSFGVLDTFQRLCACFLAGLMNTDGSKDVQELKELPMLRCRSRAVSPGLCSAAEA